MVVKPASEQRLNITVIDFPDIVLLQFAVDVLTIGMVNAIEIFVNWNSNDGGHKGAPECIFSRSTD